MTNALLNQLALISPSSRLITRVATPLPTRLVRARHSLMHLSTPTSRVSDCIGMSGMIARLAAKGMKRALVRPEELLEVSIGIAGMNSSRPREGSVGSVEGWMGTEGDNT